MPSFRLLFQSTLAVALIVTPQLAHAQLPTVDESTAHVARDRWYGWQILLADAGAVGTATAAMLAAPTDSRLGFAGVGFLGYPLGAPIIHVVHGKPLYAVADFAARAVLPIAGLAAGVMVGAHYTKTEGDEAMPQTRLGGTLGYDIAAAMVTALDVAVFSFEPRTASTDDKPPARRDDDDEAARIDVSPAVEVTRARVSVGLTGRF